MLADKSWLAESIPGVEWESLSSVQASRVPLQQNWDKHFPVGLVWLMHRGDVVFKQEHVWEGIA